MSIPILRRISAAISVLALGSAAAFVTGAPAAAVTLPGNIDPSIERTLTINKYALGPNNGQNIGTGQELTDVEGTPLAGATFSVALVQNVDLTTPAGWSQVYNLTPQTAASRTSTANTYTATTGTDGVARFDAALTGLPQGLPIGLYLVTETDLPPEATNPAAPFLVTVPFPTGPGGAPSNQWIYDVHAYPKNAVTDLTKTRVPAAPNSPEARNPDLIRWAISLDVPTLAAGDALSEFVLTDTLPDELDYLLTGPTGVAPTNVRVESANGTLQNFVENTDYTLVEGTVTIAGETFTTVTARFTPTGLNRLRALPGGNVTLNVLSRALTVPSNGIITNTASSVVNGATEEITGSTNIGQLTVFAFEGGLNGGTRNPLAGAVYRVFLNQTDADQNQNAVFINDQQDWTTEIDGYIDIPIITPGVYYVREVSPPAGFQIPARSEVLTTIVAGPSSIVDPKQNYLEFIHDQVPAFALPLTGGDGALWFTVGGIGLISIALGTGIVAARRRAATALADA